MSVRVRFAPSPTGHLHIGGARTALYNMLFAKAHGGHCILRIEDTDLDRSTGEFEKLQIEDMKWLGIEFDEGPHCPKPGIQYRQSERLASYRLKAQELLDKGLAFYDFCSEEELLLMKEKSEKENLPAYTGKWKEKKYWKEAQQRVEAGEQAPIRFLVPHQSYELQDGVRGHVTWPEGMVGDFVLLRSNGMPTYNFANIIDDHSDRITHVIRAEEHLNNTCRQLMLFDAFGWKPPEYFHLSLMIGKDRQKLSKRHGATSVSKYREEGYLPQALVNYICLLGWSHPQEKDIFDVYQLGKEFDTRRFSKSPGIYDLEKLAWVNAQHLKNLTPEQFVSCLETKLSPGHFFLTQSKDYQIKAATLFQEKCQLITEFEPQFDPFIDPRMEETTEEKKEILQMETTPGLISYVKSFLETVNTPYLQTSHLETMMESLKKDLKIKGKNLFLGLRVALTGQPHGPDLLILATLIPLDLIKKRLQTL